MGAVSSGAASFLPGVHLPELVRQGADEQRSESG